MNHVPYKSSGQVMTDVVAGHVDMAFDNIPTVAQQAQAGKVRALAVTSLERAPLMPDVPPMADFLPGFEATSWHGLFAPAGTPPEIVNKLSGEMQRIMKLPEMQEKLRAWVRSRSAARPRSSPSSSPPSAPSGRRSSRTPTSRSRVRRAAGVARRPRRRRVMLWARLR